MVEGVPLLKVMAVPPYVPIRNHAQHSFALFPLPAANAGWSFQISSEWKWISRIQMRLIIFHDQ